MIMSRMATMQTGNNLAASHTESNGGDRSFAPPHAAGRCWKKGLPVAAAAAAAGVRAAATKKPAAEPSPARSARWEEQEKSHQEGMARLRWMIHEVGLPVDPPAAGDIGEHRARGQERRRLQRHLAFVVITAHLWMVVDAVLSVPIAAAIAAAHLVHVLLGRVPRE